MHLRRNATAKDALDLLQPLPCRIHSTVVVELSTASPSGAGVERSGAVSSVPSPQGGVPLSHHAPHMYGMLLTHNREGSKPQDRVLALGLRAEDEMGNRREGNLPQRSCAFVLSVLSQLSQPGECARV